MTLKDLKTKAAFENQLKELMKQMVVEPVPLMMARIELMMDELDLQLMKLVVQTMVELVPQLTIEEPLKFAIQSLLMFLELHRK